MRIVIDLQACQNGSRHRGIGRYAMAISRAMIAAGRGHAFHILLSDAFPDTIRPIRRALADMLAQDHIHVWAMPGGAASANPANSWRTRAAELVRAQAVEALAPDLLFVPSLFEGYHDAMVTSVEGDAGYRTAVTAFDFIPIDYPHEYLPDPAILAAYHRKLGQARAADLLLPISHFVATQAAARLGDGGGRIVPVPLGVESMFRVPAEGAVDRIGLMARYGIARPFVLNTSPLEYRKNIPGLIAGFAALPPRTRDAHQLVIVGRMDEKARRRIARMAADARLPADALVLAGFVPDADLVALYATCELFAFPSISEGFGLPVLEAMACGAAVVGSATTSIPEVIGRADLMFDPLDPAAIGAAIARVLGDPALRADLRRFGPERAAGFTWETAAETMLDAFEALPPAMTVAAPAPPPSPTRAVIVPAIGTTDVADFLVALLPQIGAASDMTLICDGGPTDVRLTAQYEVRDPVWFARHGAAIGAPLYLAGGDGDMAGLIAMHPGLVMTAEGEGVSQVGALETIATPPPTRASALAIGASVRAALARVASARSVDPLRSFAARLPRAVRDVRPSSTDLVRVARAIAANEALWRAPKLFVAIGEGAPDAPLLATLRRCLPNFQSVRVDSARWVGAYRPGGGEAPIHLRAGDRLVGMDVLGGFGANSLPALEKASETGVSLRLAIIGECGMAMPERLCDWLARGDVAVDQRLTTDGSQAATSLAPAMIATLEAIAASGIPLDIMLRGDPAQILRAMPNIAVRGVAGRAINDPG